MFFSATQKNQPTKFWHRLTKVPWNTFVWNGQVANIFVNFFIYVFVQKHGPYEMGQ